MDSLQLYPLIGRGSIIVLTLAASRPDNPVPSEAERNNGPDPEDRDNLDRESDLKENLVPERAPTDPDSPDYERPDEGRSDEEDLLEPPERIPYEAPDRRIGKDDELETDESADRPSRDARDIDPSKESDTDTVSPDDEEGAFLS